MNVTGCSGGIFSWAWTICQRHFSCACLLTQYIDTGSSLHYQQPFIICHFSQIAVSTWSTSRSRQSCHVRVASESFLCLTFMYLYTPSFLFPNCTFHVFVYTVIFFSKLYVSCICIHRHLVSKMYVSCICTHRHLISKLHPRTKTNSDIQWFLFAFATRDIRAPIHK